MSTGKVLLGVTAGLAAGALLGILFAPEKGSETRQRISKKAEDYADSLKGTFNNLMGSVKAKAEAVKEETNEFVQRGKRKTEETMRDVKNPAMS